MCMQSLTLVEAAGRKHSGEGRTRRKEGGQSEEGAATGLHCTQGAIRATFQESWAREDLDPTIITLALNRNADAESTVITPRSISRTGRSQVDGQRAAARQQGYQFQWNPKVVLVWIYCICVYIYIYIYIYIYKLHIEKFCCRSSF